MIYIILGQMGAGKTLMCVLAALESDLPVVSNFKIDIPEAYRKPIRPSVLKEMQLTNPDCPTHVFYEEFKLNDFIQQKYQDRMIILDEAYTYLESRTSGSLRNRLASYILMQSRKRNVHLYLTAQLVSSIDKRYRHLGDVFVSCQHEKDDPFFTYTIYQGDRQPVIQRFAYEKVEPFFSYYDTYHVIKEADADLELKLMDNTEKTRFIEDIARKIFVYYRNMQIFKITTSMVQLYCTKHNISHVLKSELYAEVQVLIALEKQRSEDEEVG